MVDQPSNQFSANYQRWPNVVPAGAQMISLHLLDDYANNVGNNLEGQWNPLTKINRSVSTMSPSYECSERQTSNVISDELIFYLLSVQTGW